MAPPRTFLRLPPNRVWRTYLGGRTLDQLAASPAPADTHFPEDWIASTTRAINPPDATRHTDSGSQLSVLNAQLPEGLSPVHFGDDPTPHNFADLLAADPAYYLGAAHAARFGASPQLLVKFLDPSIRLHLQAHPTAAFAQKFLQAPSGKTEAYHILAVRDETLQARVFLDQVHLALQIAAVAYASPLKIFDYMTLGRAIVAPDQPNIREILTDGSDALLFKAGDAEAFKSALRTGQPVRNVVMGVAVPERGYVWILVNAIPLYAIKAGLLTVAKAGKKNIFSGRILEIEGLPDLKVEQAFELSDASAERSAAGCTIKLNQAPVIEYMNSNIFLMKNMIANGYKDARTLERRIKKMEEWLAKPSLLEADKDAEYAAVIEIDLADIKEPIVCCPNDPDDAKFLSEVAGAKIDEVFIGSCMTNIGHFRAAGKLLEGKKDLPVRLWVAPPTKMDAAKLTQEGVYNTFGTAGARTEMPGCSLCMGNQAQIKEGSTAISTSTRNFPNRLGKNTNVYLGSAELAAIASKMGKLPTPAEYLAEMGIVTKNSDQIYQYLNFNQIDEYIETAKEVTAA